MKNPLAEKVIRSSIRETLSEISTISRDSEPTRQAYLKIITDHQIPYTDNIRFPDLWIAYLFFTSLIRKLFSSSETAILDWGGLYGHVTTLLTRIGYETVHNYLLHVPTRYEHFRTAFHIETRYGTDPNRLDLPDVSYNLVISSGVLEHVQEDGIGDEYLVLKEIHRVLKPGGTFWIWYLPSRHSLSEALSRWAGQWHHSRLFDGKQITSLLTACGFEVLLIARHGFLPGRVKRLLSPSIFHTSLFRFDTFLANLPLLRMIAANFFLVAQKPISRGASPAP